MIFALLLISYAACIYLTNNLKNTYFAGIPRWFAYVPLLNLTTGSIALFMIFAEFA